MCRCPPGECPDSPAANTLGEAVFWAAPEGMRKSERSQPQESLPPPVDSIALDDRDVILIVNRGPHRVASDRKAGMGHVRLLRNVWKPNLTDVPACGLEDVEHPRFRPSALGEGL